jgi:sigma-B regulation protein RsbU (phosphoserine phosphatase)
MNADDDALPTSDGLYEAAACGLVLTDKNGVIRRANQTFCVWLGYAHHELVGRLRIQDLLTVGGRIFHQTHWAPLLRMQGSIAEVKLDLTCRDGRVFPIVLNAVSREHAGVIHHELAVFVAEDRHRYEQELMIARKRAEELLATHLEAQQALALADARLRVAIETAQLHVWHVDPTTHRRHYDEGVAELLGLPAHEPVDADRYAAHIDSRDHTEEARAFADALDPQKGAYRCVYRLNGADGIQRTVRATGDAVFDDDGRLMRFVGVLQDISELVRQRAAAEDRARFSEQMIGIVSHDLRNPLTAIKMGVHMLGTTELTAPQRERIAEHADKAADRAQRLVGDLLDFTQAKIGSGLKMSLRPVDVHHVVGDAVGELRLAFPGRIIEHIAHGDGRSSADSDRLTQLLGNLVANAMTYGADDSAVTVTSRIESDSFAIEVHNKGTPIPPHLLPTLFEPMTRGTESGSLRSVGLGLFIVREIVRAHRGEVIATSSLDAGTTFRATFPRRVGGFAACEREDHQ